MSVIDRVDDTTSTTVSDLSATVTEVSGPEQDSTRRPIRELLDDRLLDQLLARSRDEAGGLRLTGEGSMLGDLVKAHPGLRLITQELLGLAIRQW